MKDNTKWYHILKKKGGLKLIKQYFKSGVLSTAIIQFIILGKKKTALEILRLSTQFKVKQKLYRKYKKKLKEFNNKFEENCNYQTSNIIWICWLQGIENAPDIVKKCYNSVLKIEGKQVVLITKDNIKQYIVFPKYIEEKWDKGVITNTHITDLLRLELLTKYGGIWMDATVFCTNTKLPDYIEKEDLFFFQNLKPGKDGHSIYLSSWLISAKAHNKILEATKMLCYEYWKTHNYMKDYFLLHLFLSIVLDF